MAARKGGCGRRRFREWRWWQAAGVRAGAAVAAKVVVQAGAGQERQAAWQWGKRCSAGAMPAHAFRYAAARRAARQRHVCVCGHRHAE